MFYAKSTNAFYVKEVHGDNIPSDVVSVDEIRYEQIQKDLDAGGTLYGDDKGYPQVESRPEPTPEQIQETKNAQNRAYLAETDWYVTRFAETGEAIPQDVLDKRAEARKAVV